MEEAADKSRFFKVCACDSIVVTLEVTVMQFFNILYYMHI